METGPPHTCRRKEWPLSVTCASFSPVGTSPFLLQSLRCLPWCPLMILEWPPMVPCSSAPIWCKEIERREGTGLCAGFPHSQPAKQAGLSRLQQGVENFPFSKAGCGVIQKGSHWNLLSFLRYPPQSHSIHSFQSLPLEESISVLPSFQE